MSDLVEDHNHIRWWTEFHTPRAAALHEYSPVDGTPLSHGCVRLNTQMAITIFEGSRKGRTIVDVRNTPRPRCDHPMLQREWVNDFRTAGTKPPDGESIPAVRTRRQIREERRALRGALGVSEPGLTERIERLRTATGGLRIALGEARSATLAAVAPVVAEIPRCDRETE